MQHLNQAIKPNYFAPLQQIRNMPVEKVDEIVAERKEGVLASLASHEGWEILKDFITDEMKRLDDLNKIQIEAGATFDEIGKNAVLVQLCKAELQTVINKVEDARESEQSGNK